MQKLLNLCLELGADDVQVRKIESHSDEFFFIRHKLDTHRKTSITHTMVTVYKKIEDRFLGSATLEIFPLSTEEEIKERITQALYSAGFVKNPMYTLYSNKEKKIITKEINPLQIAENFITTLQNIEETENEDINSYEIFVKRKNTHFLNSRGVDVTFDSVESEAEVIINARQGNHEIEIFRDFTSGECDVETLKKEIYTAMKAGKNRTLAKPMPSLGKVTVNFTGVDTKQFVNYFSLLCNASLVYPKISTYKLNQPISTETIHGDTLTLSGLKECLNSSQNFPFDLDGKEIKDRLLIKDNIVQNYHGLKQFCDYIDYPDSGMLYNFKLEGGKKTKDELCLQPHLEVEEFSDFQIDSTTGDFAGEIRLGTYFDGEKNTIVTSGSLSGNMKEALTHLYLSSETIQRDNMILPCVISIKDVSITGAE